MLASVGLDNSIWIWDGGNFGKSGVKTNRVAIRADQIERIHRISGHEGFVKGVTWDPVGNYLATQVSYGNKTWLNSQSDDKSVRIWNTDTWQMEHKITAPFKNSPSSTFFRRLR